MMPPHTLCLQQKLVKDNELILILETRTRRSQVTGPESPC